MKKKAFEPLQSVGAGVTRVLSRFSPQQWSGKLNSLRTRAELGDSKASELLSIIGVASIVLGSGIGMAVGGKGKGGLFGSAVGGLLGAAPALANPPAAPVSQPSMAPKPPAPFDPKPWQQSDLL